ncbi:Prefoldin subunit-domain-containing protein [Lipomyces tetrasporus]|uniref:Prefoldin subunit 4 n=1 Tax=Lipomyces tetrasporus TaxID=54092 RepID=A0AAD7QNN3_9ASCO|nr:Prefoldin subunit-domain-containing protein [Lipomyces tetrasporus]KAJ8098608.1 Prefoldin subunit-domain-containing protein [Lipomyces tetrasporus]
MSLQMLPAGQESPDVSVSWEDQQRINGFSKLNSRLSELEDLYQQKKDENEYLEDVGTEIELVDEDDLVQYKIGDAFYWLKQSEVVERLEGESESTVTELNDLEDKIRSIKDEMDELKKVLYEKFGNAINLER